MTWHTLDLIDAAQAAAPTAEQMGAATVTYGLLAVIVGAIITTATIVSVVLVWFIGYTGKQREQAVKSIESRIAEFKKGIDARVTLTDQKSDAYKSTVDATKDATDSRLRNLEQSYAMMSEAMKYLQEFRKEVNGRIDDLNEKMAALGNAIASRHNQETIRRAAGEWRSDPS